jgi:hypothetical protein
MAEMTTLTAAIYKAYRTRVRAGTENTSPGITSRFELFYDELMPHMKVWKALCYLPYGLLMRFLIRSMNVGSILRSSSWGRSKGFQLLDELAHKGLNIIHLATIPSTGAKHLSASRDISDWSVQLHDICTIQGFEVNSHIYYDNLTSNSLEYRVQRYRSYTLI